MADRTGSLGRLIRDAVAEAPSADRRLFAAILGSWLLVVALQVWDVRGRSGPYAVAELFGAIVFVFGALLLALAWTLQVQADRAATAAGSDGRIATPRAIVMALPVLAAMGATCFGFAAATYILRAFLGAPIWFVIVICGIVCLVLSLALRLVARTTRSLYRWAQDQTAYAARAEADAERARLATLQAQMNPHFLFNALNTVASLVATDHARAERTIEHLAAVLRQTLARGADSLTTVQDEVRFVGHYLDVERARFGARLDVSFDIDTAAADRQIPTMSLQPLVENAIKHAIQARLRGGRIVVSAIVRDDALHVSVCDDGDGFVNGYQEGTGLGNLRRRLRSLYGISADLVIESAPAGSRVTLVLPARASGPATGTR